MTERRRFPPPWSIEESAACFIVRDHDKQALACVYYVGWTSAKRQRVALFICLEDEG
jgi:hypothetical protein